MFKWLFKKKKLSNSEWWSKYNEYLKSDKWQKIRQSILKRDKYRCQQRVWIVFKCKSEKRLNVHHKTYKRVFKERASDLVTLCSYHHKLEHLRIDKRKAKNANR